MFFLPESISRPMTPLAVGDILAELDWHAAIGDDVQLITRCMFCQHPLRCKDRNRVRSAGLDRVDSSTSCALFHALSSAPRRRSGSQVASSQARTRRFVFFEPWYDVTRIFLSLSTLLPTSCFRFETRRAHCRNQRHGEPRQTFGDGPTSVRPQRGELAAQGLVRRRRLCRRSCCMPLLTASGPRHP